MVGNGFLARKGCQLLPWIELDRAAIPGDSGELRLKQRGQEFSIMLGANELMNSRLSGSEEALATLSYERIAHVRAPAMLIGGLGMGFTLRAALAVVPDDAEVIVAELVPAVIAWARGPMADIYKGSLSDPRVTVREGDVGNMISAAKSRYDAILLDVDNGPDGLTRKTNDGLYSHSGLAAAKAALRPGGVLAIWSSAPDEAFTRRLKQAGLATEVKSVRAHKQRGARHTIWLATRAGA
jgi:spermidine synthase